MRLKNLCGFALMVALIMAQPARALIEVGRGNNPVRDDNWPMGALELANLKSRVGYWVGPPFGGGQYAFDYRGDVAAMQRALDLFGQIRTPALQVFVHDATDPQVQFLKDESDPKADTHFDWSFTVWNPNSWNHLYNTPGQYFMGDDPAGGLGNAVDPPRMDLFVGGVNGVAFTKLKMPGNVSVTDDRADVGGFAGGSAVIGDVYDMITSKPLAHAQVTVSQRKGGDEWTPAGTADSDAAGHFELTRISPGSYRISLSAANHATRLLGYEGFGGNTLKRYMIRLAPTADLHGHVVDTGGKAIAGAAVRVESFIGPDGRGYAVPEAASTTTNDTGAWELHGVPRGYAMLYVSHTAFQMLDVLRLQTISDKDLVLVMTATGSIKGRVMLGDGKPAVHGNVSVNPPGEQIGKWGGSMNTHPDGSFEFEDVPPGEYLVSAMGENPSSSPRGGDENVKTISVKAGATTDVVVIGR